ncbi:hypothetical protein [Marinobacter xestospongiae]|uniref:hypothetical protein n=1 Tax=Marinobacter xestospongiae TaxID=994319 RepID=UPI002004C8A8|nr:hypothetical protein [Marinobacter xestospongiae]MCK7566706.1 hypothetical protein [Marinobacter xestospongiae]
MALVLAPTHQAARQQASRLPALMASSELLVSGPGPALIQLFSGDPDSGSRLADIAMPADALVLDQAALQIQGAGIIEGVVMVEGQAEHARILDGAGNWWADASVSEEAGDGDIRLQTTTLQLGAYAQITSIVIGG